MAELLTPLTPRLQRQVDGLLKAQQQQHRWHGALPVLLLDRCWLQLQQVGVEDLARANKPKLIVAGASAYSRIIDFKAFAQIAASVGAVFMVLIGVCVIVGSVQAAAV